MISEVFAIVFMCNGVTVTLQEQVETYEEEHYGTRYAVNYLWVEEGLQNPQRAFTPEWWANPENKKKLREHTEENFKDWHGCL